MAPKNFYFDISDRFLLSSGGSLFWLREKNLFSLFSASPCLVEGVFVLDCSNFFPLEQFPLFLPSSSSFRERVVVKFFEFS